MASIDEFTYGCEIEWGDIDRTVKIPPELGKWDYSEVDVVNSLEPYKYIAADPLGINPPMGGEINVRPAKSIDGLIANISKLKELFPNATAPCPSHFHVHIHVPGLTSDISALHRLTRYIQKYQKRFVSDVYDWHEEPLIKTAKATQYLKYDGGRLMPDYMCENILSKSTNFEEYIRMHRAGKDGVSLGRPFRYAINTYSLKQNQTVEFRCFRASTDLEEMGHCVLISSFFLASALMDMSYPSLDMELKFPKLKFDYDQWMGYEATKYDKSRGKKVREFISV